jgi:hypothetical protein
VANLTRKEASYEQSETDPGQVPCQHFKTMKQGDSRRQAGRTMIAAIKKEMDKPRLTESVRNNRRYKTALLTKTKTEERKSGWVKEQPIQS